MPAKLAHLDALRGLAAVVVVLAHSVGAFYPHAIFGEPYAPNSTVEMMLRVPPLSLAIASHSAVCLFFILSGYVLSLSFLTRPHRPGQLAEAMLKRPVRLGGLVVATIVAGFVLMLAGAMISSDEVAAPWLAGFWKSTPPASQFLRDLVFQPFASGTTYNPPLWTIDKELLGSYLVFAYIGFSQRLGPRGRWLLLSLLALLTFRSLYVGFVLGLTFAQAQSHFANRTHQVRRLSWALLLGGLWLASQPHYVHGHAAANASAGALAKLLSDFGTGGSAMAGALLIFAAVWFDERFQRGLDNSALRFLGHISFAMYALHFLVLGSLTWHAYRALEPLLGHHLAAAIATAGSYTVLIVLSQLATRWIDQPSTRLANAMAPIVTAAVIRWWKLALRAARRVPIADPVDDQLVSIVNEERIPTRKAG